MANFIKSTDFSVKDDLITGDPDKRIKGVEIDDEFDAIAIAVATKADLFSPNFLGVPTAATASPGVNNTQLATTAFVTAADTAATTAERIATATLTNKTLTSPVINTPVINTPIINNSGTITLPTGTRTLVARDTTDTLTNKTVSLASNIVTGTKAQFNTAVSDTTFAFTNDFSGAGNQSLTTNGYQKLPGGLIIQWGTHTTTQLGSGAASIDTSFPIPFPTACLSMTATPFATSGSADGDTVLNFNRTSFGIRRRNNSGQTLTWIAIGN
jgi:hypothetical protein